jgi:hypothetical protein
MVKKVKKLGKTIKYSEDGDNDEIKGFRKGIKKSDLINSLSKEDLERLQKTRELQDMERGSLSYKIAIENDHVRRQKKEIERELMQSRINIAELRHNIIRLQEQLTSKQITEQLPGGSVMNESELTSFIQKNNLLAMREVDKIPLMLGHLRMIVGTHDYAKNEIYTLPDWESEVKTIAESLDKMGYSIFTHED